MCLEGKRGWCLSQDGSWSCLPASLHPGRGHRVRVRVKVGCCSLPRRTACWLGLLLLGTGGMTCRASQVAREYCKHHHARLSTLNAKYPSGAHLFPSRVPPLAVPAWLMPSPSGADSAGKPPSPLALSLLSQTPVYAIPHSNVVSFPLPTSTLTGVVQVRP